LTPLLKPKWNKRLRYTAEVLFLLLATLVAVDYFGLADSWARRGIVSQIERITGGRVELKAFRFRLLTLRAELEDLTIHGREPEGTPPFFHAGRIVVDVRVDSLFRRKFSLDEIRIERPAVHVRFDADGRSNVPAPQPSRPPEAPPAEPRAPGKPFRERIFDFVIREVRIVAGEMLYNDVRVPLVAEGGRMDFALDYEAPAEGEAFYRGEFAWKQMMLAARRYLPFPSDFQTRFRLARNSFQLEDLRWKLPNSEFEVGAKSHSFVEPSWEFNFKGRLNLEDLRTILRKPNAPHGRVEFTGAGRYAAGQTFAEGRWAARGIDLDFRWFHTKGIESAGDFHWEGRKVRVNQFWARVLGGRIDGKLDFEFDGARFRVDSRARGFDLAQVLRAVDNPSFPIATLHWGGSVDVDSVTTWTADFKSVESRGKSLWSPPAVPQEGEIPTTARLDYHYVMDASSVALRDSEIATPTSRLEMDGKLGARDTSLAVQLEIGDLLPWDDFINRLRGPQAEPRRIAGRAHWTGRVLGRLDQPTFAGHLKAYEASYEELFWDEIEGDIRYSPDELRLERARARRGESTAAGELWLDLDDWSFPPENRWGFEAELVRTPTDGLQALAGTAYPARGLLTGQFRGGGTRAQPEVSGLVDIAEVEAWGFFFDRVRGQLTLREGEVRVSNAEIRKAGGRITGNLVWRTAAQEFEFDAAGAAVPLDQIRRLESDRFPLRGELHFQIRGGGPLSAPVSEGTLRIVDFHLGKDSLGSLQAALRSDGRRMRATVESALETGRLAGRVDLTLGGAYPLDGDLTVEGVDLDSFIESAFRLGKLTGHSRVDGRFLIRGELSQPQTIEVEADLSHLSFDYQYLKLENAGPVRFAYRGEEIRIEQAHIRGADTDFRVSGFARFAGERALNLNLAGTVNLRLLSGFWPDLEARGAAQINAGIEGTLSNPRITGRASVDSAAASYGDFPAGLSQVRGEFIFDRNRMVFENLTAEAGGGRLIIGGTMSYGQGPLRYDLNARASSVRVRYPEGMSWLAGGTLRFAGTTQSAVLSGRVQVERLLLLPGFDFGSLVFASRDELRAPATSSPFLRNLQFDLEALSTPDSRLEWNGARFDNEASLRVRGTWERPVVLGHIHLLSGEMSFRGNRYRLTRGDINFADPIRLDPVVNIEAVTTIRQYEVTVNFSGKASRMTLAYRSEPPLPETDIVALLALGRTGEESELRTAGQQSPELGAGALLSEAISSQIGGRIERLFGISRFKVDPFVAGAGGEQNASARITIEQQVTRDLVITYISNVTSTQHQVIQVEYNITQDLSVIALRDQNGTFGLDFKRKMRFK
jgi:translocation and assembly module TamB